MEKFLGEIPVKKLVIVNNERFVVPREDNALGHDTDVHHVTPTLLSALRELDLSDKTLYLYPTPGDFNKGLFYVYFDPEE